jgi:uncharacterized membrane protein
MKIFFTFLASIPIILAVDLLWLGVFAKNYYQKMMSPHVAIEFNWIFVILFYLFYFTGIYIFALRPGIEAQSLQKTMYLAALFGFFCYMTYDLTNMATLKNWPLLVTVVDLAWGAALGAMVSALTVIVASKFS